jgi:hypothetical protein
MPCQNILWLNWDQILEGLDTGSLGVLFGGEACLQFIENIVDVWILALKNTFISCKPWTP